MAQVFTSYSRKDKDFVVKLGDAFAREKREAWIDSKDIPLTAEWQREILTNIENAENFLFVISPDSAVSPNCRKEVEHAIANNKRIFPILRRPVADDAVPEAVRKFQWIDFTDDGTFETRFAALLAALDTDLAWVNAHTRLLGRAKEWETGNKDDSFLLRGKDLREAERWIAKSSGQDPKPTTLQSQYLLASRQAATKLQRIVVGGIAIAFVIAVGLAVYAFIEKDLAERNAARARGRELAGYANASLNEDPGRSLLLAMEAVRSTSHWKEPPVIAAENALQDAVFYSLARSTLHGHSGHVNAVAFSADGKRVATGGSDNTARIWDAASTDVLVTLSGFAGTVNALAFSPDGKRLLTGSQVTLSLDADGNFQTTGDPGTTAKLWDAVTGKEIMALRGAGDRVTTVAFSPDGKRVATGNWDQTTQIWDAATGQKIVTLRGHLASILSNSGVHAASFSPNGRYVATANPDGTATIWDVVTGQELMTLGDRSRSVKTVAFSPDGKLLAAAEDRTVSVWDLASGKERLPLKGHSDTVYAVAFSPDGKYIATASSDKTAKLWDLGLGLELATLRGHSDVVVAIAFAPDGKRLVTGSWDGTAKVWDALSGPELVTLEGTTGNFLSKSAFSPDGSHIAASTDNETAKIWDVTTGKALVTLRGQADTVTCIAYSRDGKYVAIGGKDKTAKVWDAVTGEKLLTVRRSGESVLNSSDVEAVAFSPDNARLATSESDGITTLWDTANGRELLTLPGDSRLINTVAFSPNGALLATGSSDRTIKVWDAVGGRQLHSLRAHDTVAKVIFSPDGKLLAGASQDGIAKIWDVSDGRETTTLRGHSQSINDIAFSADGTRVVTASADSTVRVWDASSGQQLLSLHSYLLGLFGVAFNSDGKHLAATTSNQLQIYTLDIDELLALGRSRVGRRPPVFTPEECKRYFPSQTCPMQSG